MDQPEAARIIDALLPIEAARLGVDWWQIAVVLEPIGDGQKYRGQCLRSAAYDTATITLDPACFETEAQLVATLRHELFHLIHAPFDLCETQILGVLGERERRLFQPAWTHACEQVVRNLERLLEALTERTPTATPEPRGIPIMKPSKSAKSPAKSARNAPAPASNAAPSTPPGAPPSKGGKKGGKKGC